MTFVTFILTRKKEESKLMSGELWSDKDNISDTRMNQKTIYIATSEPSTMYACMIWIDTSTTPVTIKIRNVENTEWNTLQEILGLTTVVT